MSKAEIKKASSSAKIKTDLFVTSNVIVKEIQHG